ncbi:41584_t:CDS:2, partial [Gigaspora margarita]
PSIDTSTIVSTEVDNIKLHKIVATWIINRQRLLFIVEDTELIEILQYLNPTVQLVKADIIKKTIITLYSLGKQELRTSPNDKLYISAMAHYIDKNWALKEIIIDFGLLSGKHDGVNIANGFYRILEDYNIVSKFLAITLDNATNNNVFIQELAIKLKKEMDVSWDPECLRFQYFNHILNLAAQAALSHIKEDIKLNSVIHATPQRIELFESIFSPIFSAAIAARKKLVQYYSKTNTTIMLCTVLDPQRKFYYFVRKEFLNDEIEETKALMHYLFETEYVVSFNNNMSFSISGNTMKLRTQSILDDDFEEDEENTDKLDYYILEKPASKKIDMLA